MWNVSVDVFYIHSRENVALQTIYDNVFWNFKIELSEKSGLYSMASVL